MYIWIRRWAIRLFLPIRWRLSRRRPARALAEFAATEADSGWQFLRAIDRLEKPEHRALLFHNLLEEKEHAYLFRDLVRRLPGGRAPIAQAERKALIDEEGGLSAFLAYVCAGEMDIAREFEAYAKASSVPEARALFEHVLCDEDGHHDVLWNTLVDELGDEVEAKVLLGRARRQRIWRAWLRFSKRMGDTLLGVWLFAIYLVFGPLLFVASRRRVLEGVRQG